VGPGELIPPPPPGFVLQGGAPPPPPPGFVLQAPQPASQPAPPPATGGPSVPPSPDAPRAAPTAQPDTRGLGRRALDLGAVMADQAGEGIAAVLGLPFDIPNNVLPLAAQLLNFRNNLAPNPPAAPTRTGEPIIPGVSGADSWARIVSPQTVEPQGATERIAGRAAFELGANVLPLAGLGARAARVGVEGLDNLSSIERYFVEPMVRNPQGVIARESAYAGAAGTGAGIANEMFDPGGDGTMTTELLGSLFGTTALTFGRNLGGAAGNAIGGAVGAPGLMDDVANEAVVDRMIDNSTMLSEQAAPAILAGKTPLVNTQPLADALRQPSRVEQTIPGYQADVGVRSGDPMLQSLVQDANARSSGIGNTQRTKNNLAVNAAVGALEPQGDPAQFRLDLQTGVNQRIADALDDEYLAQLAFEEARQGVLPVLPNETARGANIRGALTDAAGQAKQRVDDLYAPMRASTEPLPLQPLLDLFAARDANLPLASQRFRPAAAGVPGRLAEAAGEEAVDPTIPLREVTATRRAINSDIKAANARQEPEPAMVAGGYKEDLDAYLAEVLAGDTAEAYQTANAARLDYGQRFERPGSAIADTLRRDPRGDFSADPSAIPSRFAQPDRGKITDYRDLMREAGSDPRAREGVADQIRADAQRAGVIERPERLGQFLADRSVMLGDFPELRAAFGRAGVSKTQLDEAVKQSAETRRNLEQGPEGAFLRADTGAIPNKVWTADNVRKMLETAGDSPETRLDLRTEFWKKVRSDGVNRATDQGADVWNATRVRDFLKDPKNAEVAKELWSDNPDDLNSIVELFDSLEAATLGRRNASGSPGTAAAISGRMDPSLTATGLASRARSVSRNQLSPVIALVDIASTWMRNRSKQVQARMIDRLEAQVLNNPGLAADLLEQYNPATYDSFRRLVLQKYGVRASGIFPILEEMQQGEPTADDEMMEAIE
jgi:hypothetical protein